MQLRCLRNEFITETLELFHYKFVTLLIYLRLDLVQVLKECLLSIENSIFASFLLDLRSELLQLLGELFLLLGHVFKL